MGVPAVYKRDELVGGSGKLDQSATAGHTYNSPGTYTVKVSSGAWSQEQAFRLSSDPRLPAISEAEGAEQLKMAMEIGGQIKKLYDMLGKLRDAKQQAAQSAEKAGAALGTTMRISRTCDHCKDQSGCRPRRGSGSGDL